MWSASSPLRLFSHGSGAAGPRRAPAGGRSAPEARAREDRLGLLERLDLLLAGRLALLEVVQGEVALAVDRRGHVPELQDVPDRVALVALVARLRNLVLGNVLIVGHERLLPLRDALVGVLDEGLVALLGIDLRGGGVRSSLLRVVHDLLDHRHGPTAAGLLVLSEALGHGARLAGHLRQGGLLAVELRQLVNRLLQDLLSGTLVRD